VGGGSTEIIVGATGEPAPLGDARSLDVGSVRLYERCVRHDPPTREELSRVGEEIERALVHAPRPALGAPLVGVAGTVTTLAAIHLELVEYDAARVHGSILRRDTVEELTARLASLSLEQRRALTGLDPKRADVIPVGAEIVRHVLTWSGAAELVVSDRGVRWGLAERLAAA
jgi:exopolyphosphatase/guanosine-5'-triphosphate,3'-diphosphate pyrophosphatase